MEDEVFIERLQEIDSTNRYIRDEAARLWSVAHDCKAVAVICEKQTAGRGQRGNVWHSQGGVNLLFSIMLRPIFLAARRQFFLSEAVALALRSTLLQYGIDARLKWPNDIYVGNRKIAGVLVELDYSGSNVEQAIIGIGLNVNQIDFPVMDKMPVSMRLLLQHAVDREELFSNLLNTFIHYYNIVAEGNVSSIHDAYRKELLGLGRRRTYIDSGGAFEGVIEDVEPTGHLLVRRADGTLSRYAFKEIEQIV